MWLSLSRCERGCGREGEGGGRAAGEDVNNALQGMRLEKRSWGFKGICVCHTNQEVSLHSEANLNRRPRAERG